MLEEEQKDQQGEEFLKVLYIFGREKGASWFTEQGSSGT
jgi:hypothetical protein